jgi:hypothetical protein
MKRKVRVWGKLNLLEVSGVGIPAYPYATLSTDCSLVKSLSDNFEQKKEYIITNSNVQVLPVDKEFEVTPIEIHDNNYKEVKKMEETTKEVQKETVVEVAKTPSIEEIQKMLKDAVSEAVKAAQTERGLVEKKVEAMKPKSLGELAMEYGLFKA